MAKHGRKGRSMGKYLRGAVDEELALGTLASKTLVRAIFDNTVTESTLISSLVATYNLTGYTMVDNAGPITVGVAHSDYSAAEIEEVIEQTASWQAGNLVEQEKSRRKIRVIGTFSEEDLSSGSVALNDGKPIKSKLNWTLHTGQSLALWAYNNGSAALATTDPDVHLNGHANLFLK